MSKQRFLSVLPAIAMLTAICLFLCSSTAQALAYPPDPDDPPPDDPPPDEPPPDDPPPVTTHTPIIPDPDDPPPPEDPPPFMLAINTNN